MKSKSIDGAFTSPEEKRSGALPIFHPGEKLAAASACNQNAAGVPPPAV
jgi:hypothetical protein